MLPVLAPVPDNLEPPDHLSDGEKAEDLSSYYTRSSKRGSVHVSYRLQEALRVLGCGLCCARGRLGCRLSGRLGPAHE